MKILLSKRFIVILGVVVASALSLFIVSYPYSQTTSQVESIAANNIRSNDLSIVLVLTIIAASSAVVFLLLYWNKRLEMVVTKRTADLRRANEQLLAQDIMQKEFINVAAHELRTPITPILMVVSIHEDDGQGKDIILPREEFHMITRNARRLKRLTEVILDVTKIESRAFKLNLEQVMLDDVILEAIQEAKAETTNENVEIKYECPTGILVIADKTRLFEVFSNLLSNAMKFTERGTILIQTECQPNEVIIMVKDSGTGIDKAIIQKLFTKLVTKSENGMDLGLFICKSLVEVHGGRIWAENNLDEKGATFCFTLPRMPKETLINEMRNGEWLTCYLHSEASKVINKLVCIS